MKINTDNSIEVKDSYDMYNLIEEQRQNIYPPLLMNKWFYSEQKNPKKPFNLWGEQYNRLVQVTEHTFYSCYCRFLNPVRISLKSETGKPYEKGLIGVLNIGLCTIDDTYHGVVFKNVPRYVFDELIDNVDTYLNDVDYLDHEEFLEFLISLGGENNSW